MTEKNTILEANILATNEAASQIGAKIKILSYLSWPNDMAKEFLKKKDKSRKNPIIEPLRKSFTEEIASLNKLKLNVTGDSPLEEFTRRSIDSLILGARLLENAGTKTFQDISIEIYGQPSDISLGSVASNLELARNLIEKIEKFVHPHIARAEECVPAQMIRKYIEDKIRMIFGADAPDVVLVKHLSAKSTASANVIKIREDKGFTIYDYDQLLHHEALIHSLTAINGLKQPILKLLGKGTPRTTKTQEGLATFAELITGSIDLSRLKRFALRIIAIEKAINGADFMEVFRYFQRENQSDQESFSGASRIFRGGNPKGGASFTKDCVYLDGLFSVYGLFEWAIKTDNTGYLHVLMSGRVAIEDLALLYPSYQKGIIVEPRYLPPWYELIEGLAGVFVFNLLSQNIRDTNHGFFESYFLKSS